MHEANDVIGDTMKLGVCALLSFLVLGLCQCPGPNPPNCDLSSPSARIAVGTATNPHGYFPVNSQSVVGISAGGQGGQHIWVQLQARDFCPAQVSAQVELRCASTGRMLGAGTLPARTWATGSDGYNVSLPITAQLYYREMCGIINGGVVTVSATINDGTSRPIQATGNVTVQGFATDVPSYVRTGLAEICAGFTDLCPPSQPVDQDAGLPDATTD